MVGVRVFGRGKSLPSLLDGGGRVWCGRFCWAILTGGLSFELVFERYIVEL